MKDHQIIAEKHKFCQKIEWKKQKYHQRIVEKRQMLNVHRGKKTGISLKNHY